MGSRVTLDSNLVIYEFRGLLEITLPVTNVCVSVITEIELLGYPKLSEVEERQILGLLEKLEVIELDRRVTAEAIRLRRETKLKLPDAIIAATAIVENAELVVHGWVVPWPSY